MRPHVSARMERRVEGAAVICIFMLYCGYVVKHLVVLTLAARHVRPDRSA